MTITGIVVRLALITGGGVCISTLAHTMPLHMLAHNQATHSKCCHPNATVRLQMGFVGRGEGGRGNGQEPREATRGPYQLAYWPHAGAHTHGQLLSHILSRHCSQDAVEAFLLPQ